MHKKSGIYKIYNIISNKIYIGSSIDIKQRWCIHRSNLKNGKHHSFYLQNAWDKYGEDAFLFEIIEEIDAIKEILLLREQYYLNLFESFKSENGYNIQHIAQSRLGVKTSIETRQKISKTRKILGLAKGKNNPMYGVSLKGEQHGMWGKTHTMESRQKISDNHVDVSGENNPRSKLTWPNVRYIRQTYTNKTKTVKELMNMFNVGKSTIYNILYNNTWKE